MDWIERWKEIPFRKTGLLILLGITALLVWNANPEIQLQKTKPLFSEKILVLGNAGTSTILFLQSRFVFQETVISNEQFNENEFNDYSIALLDQTSESTKSISTDSAKDIMNWVKSGGTLIVLQDSAIRKTENQSTIGWDWMEGSNPMGCPSGKFGINPTPPICAKSTLTTAKLQIKQSNHAIVQGIPSSELAKSQRLQITPVQSIGTEIVSIQTNDGKNYPGIVESRAGNGVIRYISFNPTEYPTLFENALRSR